MAGGGLAARSAYTASALPANAAALSSFRAHRQADFADSLEWVRFNRAEGAGQAGPITAGMAAGSAPGAQEWGAQRFPHQGCRPTANAPDALRLSFRGLSQKLLGAYRLPFMASIHWRSCEVARSTRILSRVFSDQQRRYRSIPEKLVVVFAFLSRQFP